MGYKVRQSNTYIQLCSFLKFITANTMDIKITIW